jgi:hypothetical protein
MVTFATQNVIMDPPFTKLDILICRNLLIYLTAGTSEKTAAALSLQPQPGRDPVSGERGDDQRQHRSVRAPEPQIAAVPAARIETLPITPVEFPASFVPALPELPKESTILKPPPISSPSRTRCCCRTFPARRAGQRAGRHPLHQRADRQIPGTGGRQGQLEYFRHGP